MVAIGDIRGRVRDTCLLKELHNGVRVTPRRHTTQAVRVNSQRYLTRLLHYFMGHVALLPDIFILHGKLVLPGFINCLMNLLFLFRGQFLQIWQLLRIFLRPFFKLYENGRHLLSFLFAQSNLRDPIFFNHFCQLIAERRISIAIPSRYQVGRCIHHIGFLQLLVRYPIQLHHSPIEQISSFSLDIHVHPLCHTCHNFRQSLQMFHM